MKCTNSNTGFSKGIVLIALALVLGFLTCAASFGQSAKPAITLINSEVSPMRLANLPKSEQSLLAKMPANSYHFGAATAGEQLGPERLTLQFAAAADIATIASTPDFKIEPGGSCSAGRSYPVMSSCDLLVRFTPQGPGHRLGKLTITHGASAQKQVLSLLGYAYLPVVSFTPGVVTTVPATFSGGLGLIKGARSLSVDGGDTLYIADTGNNLVRQMDSSGVLQTIAPSASAPMGVAVDTFGEVYYSEPASNLLFEIHGDGPVVQINGSGNDTCYYTAPCSLGSEAVYNPGQLAIDPYNNLFFPTETGGAALSTIQPTPATFANFYDPFAYNETGIAAFTVDSSDNLYSVWDSSKTCEIVEQPFYDAANFLMFVNKVAGGRACGFSGDGGRAGNAEIGASIGQMTFDLAGNLYFSDTSNNRIRRIDGATGVIRTIAGNGTTGYTGDGGPATAATLTAPTGVSVDSRGQVYILSGSSGSLQVVRKVGINGALTFPGQVQNTSSTALIVTLANTGNAGLSLSKSLMTGANSADFTIDPVSSTCDFTPGNTLSVGFSCALGIIFKPSALGARAATLKIYDNTLSGANYINLKGTGSAAAALKITAPVAHAQLPAGTPATFSVSATSSSGPAPTGTVTFKTDAKQMGKPVTIIAGAASTKLSGLPAGTHIISAHYNGDARYAAATATETITITP